MPNLPVRAAGEAVPINIDDTIDMSIDHLFGPPPTPAEILRTHIETAIESLIALLDAIDGNPDAEEDDPGERNGDEVWDEMEPGYCE